jgi:formylmethanofuran dehydrogenase subunit E
MNCRLVVLQSNYKIVQINYGEIKMIDVNDYLETGFIFHGHRCPAMPLGMRIGAASMKCTGS